MKIRPVLVLGSAFVSILSLGACSTSPGGGSTGGAKSISILYDANYKAALEPVVKAYEKKHPGTSVDVNYVGGDASSVLSTQLQANTLPDLFIAFPGPKGPGLSVGTIASQGKAMDLSSSSWAPKVPKTWQHAVGFEGKTYAYPGTLQSLGGVYNKSRMDELGLTIPQTWSEVLKLCASAKKRGVYAYAQGINDNVGPQMVNYALTATLVYGPDRKFTQEQLKGEKSFADSGWRDSFEKYKKMEDAGCFGEGVAGRTSNQGITDVASGKALGTVYVGAAVALVRKQAPKAEITFAPLPATDNPADTYFPAAPGYVLVANAHAKNPQAVKDFLELLAQPEHINAYAAAFDNVPTIPNSSFKAPAFLNSFNKAVAAGKYVEFPDIFWPNPNVQVVHQSQVQSVITGRTSIDKALAKMDEAFKGKG
jgi:raffinose/stachyose/melibiose transport system substrate-binding protein